MSACFCSDCTRCLRKIGKNRALKLINVYQEVIGHLHPVVDIEQQKSQLNTIYALLESAPEGRNTYPEIEQDSLDITKMVLSIALLAQTTGQSEIASALYNTVQSRIQDAMTSDTKNIQSVVLTLLAVRSLHELILEDILLIYYDRPSITFSMMMCNWRGGWVEFLGEWPWSWDYTTETLDNERKMNQAIMA